MGKRKRRAVNNKATPPPTGFSLHVPQVGPQSGQGTPDQPKNSEPLLLRHCRPSSARPYSRRSSSNHPNSSPSNLMGPLTHDYALSFKKGSEALLNLAHPGSREITFRKPEWIRPNLSAHTELSGDGRKMECLICQGQLRKKPPVSSENPMSSADVSVVAVLVCGHAYHADCLDQTTCHQDKQDPPCPICESPAP